MKEKLDATELSSGINCLKKYISYVKGLKIGEVIDYDKIISYF